MDALIGYTGFVGGNLANSHPFQALFNSGNIHRAKQQEFDLMVCAGVRAEKWIANRDGAKDRIAIQGLVDVLATVKAKTPVLISTTDVYADTRGKTEEAPTDEEAGQPYGQNRAYFERAFKEHFPNALVIRLPGLFGPGLKKNVVHDLVKNHEVEKINTDGYHQYYDVQRLWNDIGKCRELGITTLNVTSPPLKVEDLCKDVFDLRLHQPQANAPHYDMRSIHAAHWGGKDGYLYGRDETVRAMKAFVAEQRALRP